MATITKFIGQFEELTTWEYDYNNVNMRLLRFRCINNNPTYGSKGTIISTAPIWMANTSYAFDKLVQPTVYNGHVYRATVGGVSGSSVPNFPTNSGGTVVDGTITWQEIGPDRVSRTCPPMTTEVYDIPAALANIYNLTITSSGKIDGMAKSFEFVTS